jgi:hypothetical protein
MRKGARKRNRSDQKRISEKKKKREKGRGMGSGNGMQVPTMWKKGYNYNLRDAKGNPLKTGLAEAT